MECGVGRAGGGLGSRSVNGLCFLSLTLPLSVRAEDLRLLLLTLTSNSSPRCNMAQPFSFGFSGDDIDVDVDGGDAPAFGPPAAAATEPASEDQPDLTPARSHKLQELVRRVPVSLLSE